MLQPNFKNYHRDGGRGIPVCEEWWRDTGAFYAWALANGYAGGLQIERRDNDLDYSPENFSWTTHTEQQSNRSNNTKLECGGESLTLAEWSRRTGIGRTTMSAGHHTGWLVAEVLGMKSRA